ncbi:MAG: LysR substrate-binding domain-containing protein [Pseudomonadota bacterium]
MAAFEAVARHLSFTKAAAELGLTKGTVSQHVSTLEQELGLSLLNRTSRRITLTEAGEDLLPHCVQVAEAALALADRSLHETADLKGRVAITTSHTLATLYLAEAIARFQADHPGIEVDLIIRERFVDLADEGVDLALRVGPVLPEDLVARRIGTFSMLACAAPGLVPVDDPAALATQDWVLISTTNPQPQLQFTHETGAIARIEITPKTTTNSGLCALSLTLNGTGIGLLPSFAVRSPIRDGRLIDVLPGWYERRGPVSLVWSPLAKRKRRVATLITFLAEDFRAWDAEAAQVVGRAQHEP